MCRLLLAAWDSELAGLCIRTGSCYSRGRSVACAERLTVWQAGEGSQTGGSGRHRRPSGATTGLLATAVDYDASCEPNPPPSAEPRHLVRRRTLGLVLLIAPAGVVPATARRPSAPEQS